jgi:putative tryptophan/tyrosine transport system substrate-binding protein
MTTLFAILALLFFSFPTAGVRAAEIAVLMSSDAGIYQEALEGFREVVRGQTVTVQTLETDPVSWSNQLKRLRSVIEPDIVFVIGTPALQAVAGTITHVPIVHAMVFNPRADTITVGKNISGISMIPAANQAVSLIKELNPKFRRVGVMYDPARSSSLYQQAQSALQRGKMQLVAREIQSPEEIAAALKHFEKAIDLLWLWPDERFFADEILQRIFLFSFEHKIPVLGLSERHTQMGALLSLSYGNAKDMGRQAGEAVGRL